MHLTPHLLRRERPGRQLDGERRRSGQVVVLPVRRRPRQPVAVVEAHPGGAGVDPTGGRARPPRPHQVHVLVEPDRDARPDAEDQVAPEPGLPLGEWPRAGVEDVPRTATASPARRPVGVQVDAAPVLTYAPRVPVGIEVRNDPEVGRGGNALERPRHRDPGALGPVDAADDEQACPVRIARAHDDDRPAELRPADQRGGGSGRRGTGQGDAQDGDQCRRHRPHYEGRERPRPVMRSTTAGAPTRAPPSSPRSVRTTAGRRRDREARPIASRCGRCRAA